MLHTISSIFTTQDNLIQYLLFYNVIFFAVVLLLGCCLDGSSALFYVYACMYCVCFVVCRCLYVSLYLLLLLCFVCIASALFFVYAGVGVCALAGAPPPPSS